MPQLIRPKHLACTLVVLAGCTLAPTGGVPRPDAAVDDAASEDASATDVTDAATDVATDAATDAATDVATDAATDATTDATSDAPADAPVNAPCASERVIDLNARGALSGAVTTFTGTNVGTPRTGLFSAGVCGSPGNVQVFRYRPRASGRLRVTTDVPGTAADFDTLVFALSECGPGGALLGCSDDARGTARPRASTFTLASVTAGTPVYLVVAGFDPPTGAPWTAEGAFTLEVTEINQVALGLPCDTATSVCAEGASCVPPVPTGDAGVGTTGVCRADGAVGGHCATTGSPCPMGATCVRRGARGYCVPTVADGAACDAAGAANACEASSLCAAGTCRSAYSVFAYDSSSFQDECEAGGTRITLTSRDDGATPEAIPLPFMFGLYGRDIDRVWPSVNGVLALFAPGEAAAPPRGITGRIPDPDAPALIAPWWDDLVLRDSPTSDICVRTVGPAPNRQFGIQWLNAYRYRATDTSITVGIVLDESTRGFSIYWMGLRSTEPGSSRYVDGSSASRGFQSPGGAQFWTPTGALRTGGVFLRPLL